MLDAILADLNRVEGILGSLIVSKDGLLIAHALPRDVDPELIGAMAAAIFGTAERSASRLAQGELLQVMAEASGGKLLAIDAGKGILAVLTEPNCNLGLIRIEMRDAAEKIKSAL